MKWLDGAIQPRQDLGRGSPFATLKVIICGLQIWPCTRPNSAIARNFIGVEAMKTTTLIMLGCATLLCLVVASAPKRTGEAVLVAYHL